MLFMLMCCFSKCCKDKCLVISGSWYLNLCFATNTLMRSSTKYFVSAKGNGMSEIVLGHHGTSCYLDV